MSWKHLSFLLLLCRTLNGFGYSFQSRQYYLACTSHGLENQGLEEVLFDLAKPLHCIVILERKWTHTRNRPMEEMSRQCF